MSVLSRFLRSAASQEDPGRKLKSGDAPSRTALKGTLKEHGAASAPPKPARTYAELLEEYEARRHAQNDLLLRKMMHPLDPMNPP